VNAFLHSLALRGAGLSVAEGPTLAVPRRPGRFEPSLRTFADLEIETALHTSAFESFDVEHDTSETPAHLRIEQPEAKPGAGERPARPRPERPPAAEVRAALAPLSPQPAGDVNPIRATAKGGDSDVEGTPRPAWSQAERVSAPSQQATAAVRRDVATPRDAVAPHVGRRTETGIDNPTALSPAVARAAAPMQVAARPHPASARSPSVSARERPPLATSEVAPPVTVSIGRIDVVIDKAPVTPPKAEPERSRGFAAYARARRGARR
jgi:hypothetical protein